MLLVVLAAAGGVPAAPAARGELRIATGSMVETFDPHNYRSVFDLLVDNLIADTLIGVDDEMKPVPRLATSWQLVNPTTWRFQLRQGVRFHDGTAFDAQVVKTNMERAAAALKGVRFYGELQAVRVVNASTVDLVLKRPFAPFFLNLAFPVGGMVSPASLARGDPTRTLVGTGPFKLAEWVPNERVVLERNDTYWGKTPRLNRVVIRRIRDESTRHLALLGREVDVSVDPPAHQVKGLRQSLLFDILLSPQARILWLGFNFNDPVLKDKRVRQAIAHAVDRRSIVTQVLDSVPRDARSGILPPEMLPTTPPLAFEYNPTRARELLTQAGVSSLNVSIMTPQGVWLGDKAIAEVVQAQLNRVGITASVRVLEYGSLVDAASRHEQQLWIILWGFAAHPDAFFRGVFHSKSAANWTAYNNPEVDRLIDEAATITDRAKQQQAYWQIQKLLMDDVAMVPIYYAVNLYVKSKKVHNFEVHPLELLDLTETYVDP
jgi:peptide/nickel transport system substrate-binding protein